MSFSPNPIAAPGNGDSAMTISVGSTTAVGTYPITVAGNGGGIQQSTTVTLTVTAQQQPDFAISVSPTSVSVAQVDRAARPSPPRSAADSIARSPCQPRGCQSAPVRAQS